MFVKAVVLALVAGVSALVPSASSRPSVQSRREVVEQAAAAVGAALLAPRPALADGAVSPATVQRARGIYGARIAALKSAVDKGDFGAVLDEKNAFDLFNSGAFAIRSAIAKESKAKSIAATEEILAAAAAGDKSKLKSAYDTFMKNAGISSGSIDITYGQGYQSEFDWKARTPKGTIYQR